jgi:uncharacterized membrane protein YfbV (UPF0208 family)
MTWSRNQLRPQIDWAGQSRRDKAKSWPIKKKLIELFILMESNRVIPQTAFTAFVLAVVIVVLVVFAPNLEQFGLTVGQAALWVNEETES